MLKGNEKLAIYMQGAFLDNTGKLGMGVLRYSNHPIVAMIDSFTAGKDSTQLTGINRSVPIVTRLDEAIELGAEVLVLGIAPLGGKLPEEWFPVIDSAVERGLSVLNGLHLRLGERFSTLKPGQWVWDIRKEPENLSVGTGAARNLKAKRLLMVGTDMAIGKMTAGLEIYKSAHDKGVNSAFIATGQIGITITGAGVPLDAIRVDYAAGAIEGEVMKHPDKELIVVEGQGSIIHPSSTSTLPLMRGSCPTHLVLCHKANQPTLQRIPWVNIPPLREICNLYEDIGAACGVLPRPSTVGICLNTSGLNDSEAHEILHSTSQETGLPTCDPVRFGVEPILSALSL